MANFNYVATRALDCWNGGASNPRAIARALVEALDAGVEEQNGSDLAGSYAGAPARLIVAQLAYVLRTEFDGIGGYGNAFGGVTIAGDIATCETARDEMHAKAS